MQKISWRARPSCPHRREEQARNKLDTARPVICVIQDSLNIGTTETHLGRALALDKAGCVQVESIPRWVRNSLWYTWHENAISPKT